MVGSLLLSVCNILCFPVNGNTDKFEFVTEFGTHEGFPWGTIQEWCGSKVSVQGYW